MSAMPQRTRALLTLVTVAMDMAMAALAFFLSHRLREWIPLPTALYLGPFRNYLGQMAIQLLALVITFFLYRLYHLRRGGSRIDLFYTILAAVSISTVVAIALSYLNYRGDRALARGMILYGWALPCW
jgi:FlaA1/EpsC-like NDP-sugar epimerase